MDMLPCPTFNHFTCFILSETFATHCVANWRHRSANMKLHVDKEANALYLRLDDSTIVESDEVSPGVVLDYNESNELVGVEMLHLSRHSSNIKWSSLEFETT